MPLTDIQIKRAKPQDKPYTLNDGQGLSLLINPDGSKGWRFRFRFTGKARLMSFGSYELVSLAAAREKRDTARKPVANGIDPVEERKAQKLAQQLSTENSFEAICREWHSNKADRWTVTGHYPYIFIGRNNRSKPISKENVSQVIELPGYKGRATGHGFRHTISTILHEQGFDSACIEMQLAYVDKNSIRGTYNHAQYYEKRKEMMQWYSDQMMYTLER